MDAALPEEARHQDGRAKDLPDALVARIRNLCKRIYRALELTRLRAHRPAPRPRRASVYVLEANPNPQLAYGEDFAESAERAGIVVRRTAPAHREPRPPAHAERQAGTERRRLTVIG